MPPQSSATRRIVQTIKWLPFGFILGLIVFAYVVLIDLQVRYNLVQRHYYVSALFNVAVTCVLAGLAAWAFVVAVFKHPGHPDGAEADLGRGWDVRPAIDEGIAHTNGESRWERNERKREQARQRQDGNDGYSDDDGGKDDTYRDDDGDRTAYSDDNDDDHQYKSDVANDAEGGVSAPLLHNEQRQVTTGAFDSDGLAAVLPGQPQVPSRTGRAQLDDLMTIISHARQHRRDGRVFLSGLQVKNTGARRWCHKCACEKPDRAHHCSSCGMCVLRMDHHCPWLASRCIGLRNHKAFFLFLAYTSLLCVYAGQMTARELVNWVDKEPQGYETTPISWAIIMFTGIIFGLALIPFTSYHAYLILRNRTTLESMEGSGRVRISVPRPSSLPPRESVSDRLRRLAANPGQDTERDAPPSQEADETWKRDDQLSRDERRALKRANKLNIYDLGVRSNWEAVMGPKWPLWLVPIGDPESDGHSFEVNVQTLEKVEETTASIRGNGRDQSAAGQPTRTMPRVSSVRGQTRSKSNGEGSSTTNSKGRPTGKASSSNEPVENAHGTVAWGASPRRDFVLYDVHDEDEDASALVNRPSGVLDPRAEAARQQQDANVWSS